MVCRESRVLKDVVTALRKLLKCHVFHTREVRARLYDRDFRSRLEEALSFCERTQRVGNAVENAT